MNSNFDTVMFIIAFIILVTSLYFGFLRHRPKP